MFKKLFADRNYLSKFILTIDGEGDSGVDSGSGAGDSGSAGQGESQTGESQGGAEDQSRTGDQSQAGSSQHGFQPRRNGSDWIPKQRFDQVNRGFQAYRSLGSPAEIAAMKAEYERLKAIPSNKYDPKTEQEIREDFLRLFPEMRAVVNAHQTQTSSFVSTGVRKNDTFLKELNLEVNQVNNQMLQDAIGGIIARDPDLNERFYARDPTVFDDGFRLFKKLMNIQQKRVVPGLDMARTKTVPRVPSKPNAGNGGTPPSKKVIQPGPLFERETLDQASEEAFARLGEQME